jgi:hypothetical protein
VSVDQARHQRAGAAIDDLNAAAERITIRLDVLILLPSTTTLRPVSNLSDFPSNTRTFVKATGDFGASGMPAEAAFGQNAAPAMGAAPVRTERLENFCVTSAFRCANAGL